MEKSKATHARILEAASKLFYENGYSKTSFDQIAAEASKAWEKELSQSNVVPTLPDAVAGDITAAMPYRAMTNIIGFIEAMDQVVPGFAAYETLLYAPELKFYSNRVKMDTDLNTSIQGLHCLGDSSGWTRGLMMASVMGVLMGRKLAERE